MHSTFTLCIAVKCGNFMCFLCVCVSCAYVCKMCANFRFERERERVFSVCCEVVMNVVIMGMRFFLPHMRFANLADDVIGSRQGLQTR